MKFYTVNAESSLCLSEYFESINYSLVDVETLSLLSMMLHRLEWIEK